MMNFVSKTFLLLGFISVGFAFSLLYHRYSPTRIAFAGEISSVASINPKYAPSEIYIPSLSIKLPVVTSNIIDGKWEASSIGVNYLVSSPLPGNTGNSVLYGHNWSSLLGQLVNIKKNESIFVTYPGDITREFRVSYTSVVEPSDIGVLKSTTDKRITIYTCTGFLDSKRFVVTAILKE